MSLGVVGQRCLSEREPELGLGLVSRVDAAAGRIAVDFPATGEKRLYALGTPVLKRVQFRVGETVTGRDGATLVIQAITDDGGLLTYEGPGRRLCEDALADGTSVSSPVERFMAGQADAGELFDLRHRTWQAQARILQSDVRGYLGGRLQLIPHQFYILQEVASRQIPRVLLADEVGLGKTIEACLILQRLLAVGKVRRVLILVPESLIHQWFVELLRRFNLWFSIYDEARCVACEESDPGGNPFLAAQFALGGIAFLAGDPNRREQAVSAGWDILVVDEAHHLRWTPAEASPEYALVEALARKSPGLLLLSATPTQLGLAGHFARLRLLDPDRYTDLDAFRAEADRYGAVADIVEEIRAGRPRSARQEAALRAIFVRDPARLEQHLADIAAGRPDARAGLLAALLDQHGTGRVVFRNTRAAMTGFPRRKFCPAPLGPGCPAALPGRLARELRAEETGEAEAIRYSFRDDPRVDWLVDFLHAHRPAKVLLIGRTPRKAMALAAALQEKAGVKAGLFHEGLPLVQRDRQAAWFAEPDGAQLLICSEIGSEGRNFQFAHHLVLLDLPLNPGLLEQRIGRLDRIGQTETIRVHVPYLAGSGDEAVVHWYHRGLDAFESPLHGGIEYQEAFRERLLALATRPAAGAGGAELDALIAETSRFRRELTRRLQQGRDRLLELASFRPEVAERVLARVRAEDADPSVRNHLLELLDHFGVRIKDHEEGDVFLDPAHAYLEGFPSLPAEGLLATFDRARAVAREDIRFVTADHPLVRDTIDLLLESKAGTTALGRLEADEPGLLLEAVFVLEAVADARWHVEQFLAPVPVRVLVDVRGTDQTERLPAAVLAAECEDADLHRFLETAGFDGERLRALVGAAAARAGGRAQELIAAAVRKADGALGAETQRLVDLQKLNDHVRDDEITLARAQAAAVRGALERARLRLDALRVVVAGPGAGRPLRGRESRSGEPGRWAGPAGRS